MFKDKYKGSKFNGLAEKLKSYSAKGETLKNAVTSPFLMTKECPVVVQYEQDKKCKHANKSKKFLFTSAYYTCANCGEEL